MNLSVRAAALEAKTHPALLLGKEVVTYEELAARVAAMASSLGSTLPPERGDLIAMVGRSDRPSLILLLSLFEMGRPVLLLHPRLAPSERNALLSRTKPLTLLDPASIEPSRGLHPPALDPVPGDERLLAVLFTSGSSGVPKGVCLSRRAFIASARESEQNLGWQDDDRWLLSLPVAHVGGLSVLTRCLLARRTVVVPESVAQGRRAGLEELVETITAARVTLLSLVPTQLAWLLARVPAWHPPSHLRAVLLGGAPATPRLLADAVDRGVPVLTTYGMTETCSQLVTQARGTVNRGEHGVGRPLPGVGLRTADGVIEVRGPMLFSGYYSPDGCTPAIDAEGWFRTGDHGHLDESGCLHVHGRGSDLIITGGENVHPEEVEATLESFPGIAAACVFGITDAEWGQRVAAALVVHGPLVTGELATFLATRLARFKHPRLVARVDALVIGQSGKLDRAATAALAAPSLRAFADS